MNHRHYPFISTLFICLCLVTGAIAAEDILYARYPCLSPDGSTIAFTYMGDIWTVPSSGGRASRLTVHEAEDILPQYSPDGKHLLFSSRRFDNYDVFIIPSEGGTPKQVTVHSADDFGTGWTPKGDTVIFHSNREGRNDIYKVAITGGTPIMLTGYFKEHEFNGRISSDGKHLLFNSGSGWSRWWRRDLQSSRNCDIYLQDRTKTPFTSQRLTTYEGHDVWPVYNEAAGELYFISCRGDWAQIWKQPMENETATPLTSFVGDGVQWLNSNPQSTQLVFEQGFKIWRLDPAEGTPVEVPIIINSDERTNLRQIKEFNGNIEWFSLSPDEKKIAAVIHGEIFIIPAEDPTEGICITHTPTRETTPVWSADSRRLYFASDRTGNYDIYSVDVVSGIETRLTSDSANEVKPIISPDGNYLAFYRGLDKIIRLDVASGRETDWIEGTFFDLGVESTIEYNWSPDSRWLVFTMAGPTYETNIFAAPIDGAAQDISKISGYNYRPRFSTDGKFVYFSRYNDGKTRTYKIELTPAPQEFFEAAFDSLFLEEPDQKKDKAKDKKDDEVTPAETIIDFNRIEARRSLAYKLQSSSEYPIATTDGKKFAFVATLLDKPEIWAVNADDDPDLVQLTHSGSGKSLLTISTDSKTLYYLEEGKIKTIGIDGKDGKTLSFKAALDIDQKELAREKFAESWQMLNTYFYDGDFHGTDWKAVFAKYEPVVDHIRTEPEFRNFIKEMLGELRASHLDIYSREKGPDAEMRTGETGIEFDYGHLDKTGEYRVLHIVPLSPADMAGIRPGQFVTAINGQPVDKDINIFNLLVGTAGNRVSLTMSDKPGGKMVDMLIKPISRSEMAQLKYDGWVESRRHIVDSLSQGRLGYLHIQAMSGSSLEKFKEELVSIAEPRDGLILDVRDNGGGNIAVHLLEILVKTPYFLRNFRDFPVTTENKMRSKALEKPMTLLTNSYSASNSEIFAEGFRKLHLGQIIGEPTAGAVIGTSSYGLIDGTRIRRPSWGAFTVEMEDTDIKRRYPDILVEHSPDDNINGRDRQLERAIEELMKKL